MSPDRRPGLGLSRRRFVLGSAATLLLVACGQVPQAPSGDSGPNPVRLPLPGDSKPVDNSSERSVSSENNREIPVLKTQLAFGESIDDANKEPTKVPVPTRTPVLAKPGVVEPAPLKPAGKNLDDEAKENALLKWLYSMNRPNQSDNKYDLDELKTSFFSNRGGRLQPITVPEIVGRFLNPNEEIDTTLEWISKDIGSFTGAGTLSRHVRGLAEIKRGDNISPAVAFFPTNERGVEFTRFDITGSDIADGIEWRGGVRIGITVRSKFVHITTGVDSRPELKNPDGPFSAWRGEGVIIPLVKKGGAWGNPPHDPTRMPNFLDMLAGLSAKTPIRIMEEGIFGGMLTSDCPVNQACTIVK